MRSLLNISTVVLLAAAAGTAPAQPKDEPGLKLAFPDVKGWERLERRPLPPESGGYSIGYNSNERIAVTFYVYNRGRTEVSDDLSAKEVQKEFTGAKGAIIEAKDRGFYEDAKEEKSGESTLGGVKDGPKALYARYRLRIKGEDTLSEIYVLPYRNHFIKVRVTRGPDGPASAQEATNRLFTEVGKLLVKK